MKGVAASLTKGMNIGSYALASDNSGARIVKIVGDLVSFVNESINRIEESDLSCEDVFYNVRCEIAHYESIILRSINDNREDLTKINHSRVKVYCELFDMLRGRLETAYKNWEAQK